MITKPTRPESANSDPFLMLNSSLDSLRNSKPNDRSEQDRRYAVAITELEKVIAYFKTYVIDYEPPVNVQTGDRL